MSSSHECFSFLPHHPLPPQSASSHSAQHIWDTIRNRHISLAVRALFFSPRLSEFAIVSSAPLDCKSNGYNLVHEAFQQFLYFHYDVKIKQNLISECSREWILHLGVRPDNRRSDLRGTLRSSGICSWCDFHFIGFTHTHNHQHWQDRGCKRQIEEITCHTLCECNVRDIGWLFPCV